MKESLTNKTISGLKWTISGAGAQALIQLVVFAILARIITPEEFGLVALGLLLVSFSEVIAQVGVGPAIVQRKNVTRHHLETGLTLACVLGGLVSLLFLICSSYIERFFNTNGLADLIDLLSLYFLIRSIAVVSEAKLLRNLRFRRLAAINLCSEVFGYSFVAIGLGVLGYGATSLIIALLVKVTIRTVLIIWSSPLSYPGFSIPAAKELLIFGSGFGLARIFNFFAGQGGPIVIGKVLGVGALGYFTRAQYFVDMSSAFIGKSVDQVIFASMAKVQSEPARLTRAFNRALSAMLLFFSVLACAGVVLAPEFVLIVLGEDWVSITRCLQILIVGIVFRVAYKVSDSLVRAVGAVYQRAKIQFFYALFVIISAYISSSWGIEGVAAAISVAVFLNHIFMLKLSATFLSNSFSVYMKLHSPLLLSVCIVMLPLYIFVEYLRLNNTHPFLVLLAGGFITILLSFFLVHPRIKKCLVNDAEWCIDLLVRRKV